MSTKPVNVIEIRDVSKRFVIHRDKSLKERAIHVIRKEKKSDDFWALRDIDIDVVGGSTVGLVGHNGSGKSTLLKLIGGILQPTSGTVRRRGRLAALLELGAGFHPDLTGRENVYLNASILGLSTKQTDRYFDGIVDFSGIEQFIDTQVKFYSSGMYVRLAFAVAVHVDPDVLLVDEVLSVGDEPFQRKCMDRIHEFQTDGRTIVLVSHSSGQVGELCDRTIVLDSGLIVFDGAAEDGLRVLREGYEEARHDEESGREITTGPKPSGAVVGVEVLDSAGTVVHQITSGEQVDIVVTYSAENRLVSWRAGIAIETPLAQVVFGTNTHLTPTELPPLDGQCRVRFTIPHLALVTGQYYVTAALELHDGSTLDWKSQAALFSVRSDGTGTGVADLRPRIEADASSPASR